MIRWTFIPGHGAIRTVISVLIQTIASWTNNLVHLLVADWHANVDIWALIIWDIYGWLV